MLDQEHTSLNGTVIFCLFCDVPDDEKKNTIAKQGLSLGYVPYPVHTHERNVAHRAFLDQQQEYYNHSSIAIRHSLCGCGTVLSSSAPRGAFAVRFVQGSTAEKKEGFPLLPVSRWKLFSTAFRGRSNTILLVACSSTTVHIICYIRRVLK